MAGPVKIIAGLGNPGREYANTRHNTGWITLNKLARRCTAEGPEEERCDGLLVRCGEAWLFKPLGYVNASGPAVASLCREAGAGLEDLLVLADDLNLDLGMIRLRRGGSSGGHKGLISLTEALGTESFPRLRMGIGPLLSGTGARDFVLSPFAPDEQEAVENMTEEAAEAALCWARQGIEVAMNRFNSREQQANGSRERERRPDVGQPCDGSGLSQAQGNRPDGQS